MNRQIEVLGLGCIAVDDLLYVDRYPQADEKIPVLQQDRQCGGLTGIALMAAARLGAACAYGGALGENELSQFALGQLEAEGVATSTVCQIAHARPIHSTIVVDQTANTRNIFYDLSGVESLPGGRADQQVICNLKALLVDHYSVEAQTRAAAIARQASVPVVADFECSDVTGFDSLMSIVDHLIVSQDFAMKLTAETTPAAATRALWTDDREVVVVTCGAEGCWTITRATYPEVLPRPTIEVDVVDTTGCGDVFHGAYAAALVRGKGVIEAIDFASVAAAIKATRRGAQQGAPYLHEVDRLLDQVRKEKPTWGWQGKS